MAGALRLSPLGRWDQETTKRCGESDKRKAPVPAPYHPLSLRVGEGPSLPGTFTGGSNNRANTT
ncbi:hypothetical protein KSF_080630 [Reticulibacter mediterranei]|uniref:Uncharacterized protein n=1 Tax=Reticulibacter mediterranei TaxID=2778369 RepID=A0A8J3IT19_9CHLR|nr:hypothetical protein KSF_080630 [Reticulibacter mediterranei]